MLQRKKYITKNVLEEKELNIGIDNINAIFAMFEFLLNNIQHLFA